jgi:hypothetical protein
MAIQGSQPDNKSFLSPLGFKFTIQRLPHVNYFCTSAELPDIAMGQIDTVENTFVKLPVPGDKLVFGLLNLRFRVDEDMKNFREIYDWLIGLGYPDNFSQSASLRGGNGILPQGEVYSDGSLIITTSSFQPNIEVRFVDMYPVSLSSVTFNLEQSDIEYLQADVNFAYRKYELTTIA